MNKDEPPEEGDLCRSVARLASLQLPQCANTRKLCKIHTFQSTGQISIHGFPVLIRGIRTWACSQKFNQKKCKRLQRRRIQPETTLWVMITSFNCFCNFTTAADQGKPPSFNPVTNNTLAHLHSKPRHLFLWQQLRHDPREHLINVLPSLEDLRSLLKAWIKINLPMYILSS